MSDLQVTYEQLRRAIGLHLGSGRSSADWDTNHEEDIEEIIQSALRSVDWPVINPETGETYRWRFLEQDLPILLVADQADYNLPENYTGLKSTFIFPAGYDVAPIAPVPYASLRVMLARKYATGAPAYCAPREAQIADGERSRKILSFYPVPDATHAVQVVARMSIEPTMISAEKPYPSGGVLLAECIIEACLAAADKFLNPEAGGGIHAELFAKQLEVAIAADKQAASEEANAEFALWPMDAITGGLTSLEVTKAYLDRAIGVHLDIGPNPDTWSHAQKAKVADVRRRGLRMFYHPRVLPNESYPHQWSFAKPKYEMALLSGVYQYDMPADYVMPPSVINFSTPSGVLYDPIEVVAADSVTRNLQISTSSSRPTMAGFRVKHTDPSVGTRWEMVVFPVPDQDFAVEFRYGTAPEQIGYEQALPLGGQPHAETVLEACLAAAEIEKGEGTFHQENFLVCLEASVRHDQMVAAPETLGYSADGSDDFEDPYNNAHGWSDNLTLYRGQLW